MKESQVFSVWSLQCYWGAGCATPPKSDVSPFKAHGRGEIGGGTDGLSRVIITGNELEFRGANVTTGAKEPSRCGDTNPSSSSA